MKLDHPSLEGKIILLGEQGQSYGFFPHEEWSLSMVSRYKRIKCFY